MIPRRPDDRTVTADLTRLVRTAQMRDEIELLEGENRRLREDLVAARAEIERLTRGGIFDTTKTVETIRVGDD